MSDLPASSSGQRDLGTLLKTMTPVLGKDEYVFCSISKDGLTQLTGVPLGLFREEEGITVILTVEQAVELALPVTVPWRRITLSVHSDLEAVGFLAAITRVLADANISVNAVSAYFHDHLFVPGDQAPAAMDCLVKLSSRS